MSKALNALSVTFLVTAFISGTAPLGAQGPWLPAGLQGHNIWALEVSPSGYILAGTAEQEPKTMFRSTDFGVTWSETIGLPSENEIWEIEIDPTDESVVYAGLNGAGAWKSLDGGATWSWSNLDGQIWDIAISPTQPLVLYIASQTGGIYKSTDGGGSWAEQTSSLFDNATAIAVHPTDPDIALAGTPFAGVFKTVNGGLDWVQSNTGFGSTPDIRSLIFDPQNPTIAYAGEMWQGVFKSLDGGVTWFRPDATLVATVGSMEFLDQDLYITNVFDDNGIPAYRSQDGGLTWQPLTSEIGHLWPRSLAVAPGVVLLGTGLVPNPGGIFIWDLQKTVDSVLTWVYDAVSQGELSGTGGGSSAGGRLNALINMIELTAELVEGGMTVEACDQLLDVLLKTDGQSPPPDFVSGPAAEELAQSIQEVRNNLDCS